MRAVDTTSLRLGWDRQGATATRRTRFAEKQEERGCATQITKTSARAVCG